MAFPIPTMKGGNIMAVGTKKSKKKDKGSGGLKPKGASSKAAPKAAAKGLKGKK
jgi:hypothetical protein